METMSSEAVEQHNKEQQKQQKHHEEEDPASELLETSISSSKEENASTRMGVVSDNNPTASSPSSPSSPVNHPNNTNGMDVKNNYNSSSSEDGVVSFLQEESVAPTGSAPASAAEDNCPVNKSQHALLQSQKSLEEAKAALEASDKIQKSFQAATGSPTSTTVATGVSIVSDDGDEQDRHEDPLVDVEEEEPIQPGTSLVSVRGEASEVSTSSKTPNKPQQPAFVEPDDSPVKSQGDEGQHAVIPPSSHSSDSESSDPVKKDAVDIPDFAEPRCNEAFVAEDDVSDDNLKSVVVAASPINHSNGSDDTVGADNPATDAKARLEYNQEKDNLKHQEEQPDPSAKAVAQSNGDDEIGPPAKDLPSKPVSSNINVQFQNINNIGESAIIKYGPVEEHDHQHTGHHHQHDHHHLDHSHHHHHQPEPEEHVAVEPSTETEQLPACVHSEPEPRLRIASKPETEPARAEPLAVDNVADNMPSCDDAKEFAVAAASSPQQPGDDGQNGAGGAVSTTIDDAYSGASATRTIAPAAANSEQEPGTVAKEANVDTLSNDSKNESLEGSIPDLVPLPTFKKKTRVYSVDSLSMAKALAAMGTLAESSGEDMEKIDDDDDDDDDDDKSVAKKPLAKSSESIERYDPHDDDDDSIDLSQAMKSSRRENPLQEEPPPSATTANVSAKATDAPTITSRPASTGSMPPLRHIKEEDSQALDNSMTSAANMSFVGPLRSSLLSPSLDNSPPKRSILKTGSVGANLSSETIDLIRGASTSQSSIAASVASAPVTEKATKKSLRRLFREESQKSSGSVASSHRSFSREDRQEDRQGDSCNINSRREVKRNPSFKVGKMWKGLKRRITGGSSVKSKPERKSQSPPPTRTSPFLPTSLSPTPNQSTAGYRRAHTSPVRSRQGRLAPGNATSTSSQSVTQTRGRVEARRLPERGRSRSEEPIRTYSPFGSRKGRVVLTGEELSALENIAKAFKEGIKTYEHYDRLRGKTLKQCFNGSAAVDFLVSFTNMPRSEAMEVGRQIAAQFGLFVNASLKVFSTNGTPRANQSPTDAFLLQDSTSAIYRLVGYLPSEVKRMNLETKAKIFEVGVKVRNRRQGLRKHKRCFIGAEAVNFLVQSRIVSSRAEAVDLGHKFVTEFNLFEPVNRDHDFIDARNKLYRFVDKRNRYFSINNLLSTRMVQMGRQDTDVSEDAIDADEKEDDGTSSIGAKSDGLSDAGSAADESQNEEQADDTILTQDYQRLTEVAEILERGIKVSDNTSKATSKKHKVSYADTFMAARAVTFMVTSGLAETREEAEKLGRRMEREFNLFSEVTGKHDFSDSNHFFRFTDKRDRFTRPVKVEKPIEEIALAFEQGVKVRDHTYRLKTYKKTFSGTHAVDFLVNSGLAVTRSQAVRIGCQLADKFNLFERVTGNKEFCDDQQFFRFTPLEERRKPEADSPKERRRSGRAFLLTRSTPSKAALVKNIPEELLKVADSFLEGIKVKEHKFRAKAYRQTFVGSEAVSFMVNSSLARSRKEAVDLGKKLSLVVGLFVQIDGSKDFKDDYLLYRFAEKFENALRNDENDTRVNVKSLPLEKIAEAFRNGIKVSDHKKKSKTHKDTFVGTDAVDFLVGSGMAESRVDAVDLGRSLAREFELFEHVQQEHEFEDEDFLYRFCYEGEIRPLEAIEIEISRLMNIAKDFEQCVKVKEHKFRMRKYKNTFLGTDAVDYLVNACTASSRKEAVQIGRAITKEFNLFEHVTNDRMFEDANIPYFFVKNNQRYKGLNLEKKRARRNIFVHSDDDSTSSEGEDDLRSSANSQTATEVINFSFQTEDTDWATKMSAFERRMHSTSTKPIGMSSTRRLVNRSENDDDSSVDSSVAKRDIMRERFFEWASKFHRLDPRYQIQYFFDFVAQDGAEDVEAHVMEVDNLRPLFNFLPNRAQVFSVWRPTSADAIRKMMLGEAVGKGLDIKGKSAKRGKLSGFVPFLQIGENKHKSKIRPPSKEGVVRVFYPSEARRGRDIAAEKLERVALEMIQTVEEAKKVLEDNEVSKSARKDALDSMLLDLGPDPSITYIDDYAPQRYGLEIPERLFWEAFFVRQDCTRKPGSEHDTGRPSQPAFQDMNFAAIRAEPKVDAPRAVVYQSADPDSPMSPFELLVAYEENGRVMPVVSDFDCFLVGTKRVNFTSPLAPEQMSVLKWYVNEIEYVMKTSKVGDSWTVNWLEVLKKAAREGFYPEMPRFGFGDPKSYSIMKNAVSRLSHSGAVRHGAECFNYYFPQDLDDEFLVIANDLPDNKPWAYVDVEGLQDILEQKIGQGYTFPLNPKWVLCDSFRWKELYDKLLLSDKKETQQSMNIWFPPESGLREQIERIHQRRPNGFYKEGRGAETDDDSESDSNAPTQAKDMMSTVVALRLLEKFQARTKKFQNSGAESNDDVSDSE